VAAEELVLYFLVAPAIGYFGATFWTRSSMRRVAETRLGFLREPDVTSRFLLFTVLFATPIGFGALLFLGAHGLEILSFSGQVARLQGLTFATAAVLTVMSQAWIVVRRMAVSYGTDFGKVLILALLPTSIVVVVIFSIQMDYALEGLPRGVPLASPAMDSLVLACAIMGVTSLAAPLVAFLANRVESLEGRGFVNALRLTGSVGYLPVVGLFIALWELAKI